MKFLKFFKNGHSPDYVVIFSTIFLVIFGLVMLMSASSNLGKVKFGDSYFYLKHQLISGLIFGILGFWLTSRFYYRYYQNFAVVFLMISIILLLLVFTPLGMTSGGATRWLHLGPFTFQPSELLKIFFIIYLASWLGSKSYRQHDFFGGFLPFLIILSLIGSLLLLQPSTSTAVILTVTALIIYFTSGAKISYIFSAIILGLIGFLIISYSTPYRWERIMSFINPSSNIQTSSYQINQALIAIGSGGLWGVGYGQSTTKLRYLPQPIDDSIFAVIAEELGFIGSIFVIFVFISLIIRIFLLSRKTSDEFGKLLLVGFGSLIALQAFMHIGAISGLIPLTGVPLPYISYGGTALAIFMTISGIIVNISKYT
ncbi:MAG: putative peptidoglycan glycosyltransferase FtsW [bacterium]|nr:putative peptidoglycan glycosyltransferase FtsW [bacterium]